RTMPQARARSKIGRLPSESRRVSSLGAPDLAGDFDHTLQLPPLLVLGQLVAVVRAREATLRRETEAVQRDVLRRLVDPPRNHILRLERPRLRRRQAQHHRLGLRQEPERLRAPRPPPFPPPP